jgi:hypothetical protein
MMVIVGGASFFSPFRRNDCRAVAGVAAVYARLLPDAHAVAVIVLLIYSPTGILGSRSLFDGASPRRRPRCVPSPESGLEPAP